jgi:hypothetical protein
MEITLRCGRLIQGSIPVGGKSVLYIDIRPLLVLTISATPPCPGDLSWG